MLKSEELGIKIYTRLEQRIERRRQVHENEFENLKRFDHIGRHRFFIKKICASDEVWSLWDDSGLQTFLLDGKWCAPFWTDEYYVQKSLTIRKISSRLKNPKIIPIPIDDWINQILWDDLASDGVYIISQPMQGVDSITISVSECLDDIKDEFASFISSHKTFDPQDINSSIENWIKTSLQDNMKSGSEGKLPD